MFWKSRFVLFFCSNRTIWSSQPWTVYRCTVYKFQKFHFLVIFSLKMGPAVLFIHLKIISLFRARLDSAFAHLHFENHVSFFFLFQQHYLTKSTINSAQVHCSWIPQISLFSHFFIKNESHNIIHTFKNHFATMFSILTKINLIQTDCVSSTKPTWESLFHSNIQFQILTIEYNLSVPWCHWYAIGQKKIIYIIILAIIFSINIR